MNVLILLKNSKNIAGWKTSNLYRVSQQETILLRVQKTTMKVSQAKAERSTKVCNSQSRELYLLLYSMQLRICLM